ncbi:MAG: alpha/beta hydrolase, partial [Bacteroidales bacterium]|nr:alpha/beta hydrolase [Bacteroidales bacterium]
VYYFYIAQALAKQYHVILYDLRGHGLSDAPLNGYDLESMSLDLLSILDLFKLSKVNVTGYSFGGLIALHTALYYPQRINKLVIIESPDLNDGKSRPLLDGYNKDYLDQYLKELSLSTSLVASRRKVKKNHMQVQFLFEKTTLKADLMKDLDLFDRIEKNPLPHETLLLYAQITECENAALFLHQKIKKSRLFFGEGDHSIPVQNPGWIVDKMFEFYQDDKAGEY